MSANPFFQWALFGIVVVAALLADLLVFHRDTHEVNLKEALVESAGWIAVALAFGAWIYFSRGQEAGLQFLTAYLLEKSLSIDNVLVFLLIFTSLGVPARSQHKVLFCGVAGALVFRGVFVFTGIQLLQRFHGVLLLFGAILLATGVRMLFPGAGTVRPERNWLVRLTRLVIPIAAGDAHDHLLVKENGKWKATSLLLALVAVEAMDLVFAVDSVPAVLAISHDAFIAYASNAFAILGLRAFYFALAATLTRLRYLHQGLAVILIFVAGKMFAGERLPISTGASLVVIATVIILTVLASLLAPPNTQK
jgi:tellurite resistance protein TerC